MKDNNYNLLLSKFSFLLLLISKLSIGFAESNLTTIAQNPVNSSTISNVPSHERFSQDELAKAWDLSSSDIAQYFAIMNGAKSDYYREYFKGFTPAEVLGVMAIDDNTRNHYAEIVAKEEHQEASQILAFNNALTEQAKRLYQDIPIIKDFPSRQTRSSAEKVLSIEEGEQVVLIVDGNKPEFTVLPKLIAQVRAYNIHLDLFVKGELNDIDLRAWVKAAAIPADLIASHQITINHENASINKAIVGAQLPYAAVVRAGKSYPLQWDKL